MPEDEKETKATHARWSIATVQAVGFSIHLPDCAGDLRTAKRMARECAVEEPGKSYFPVKMGPSYKAEPVTKMAVTVG